MTREEFMDIVYSELHSDGDNYRANRIIDAADEYAEAQSRWILVSERLPEDYGEYLCTMSNDYVQECGFVPSRERELIAGWSTCEADGFKKLDYQDIIAWMPLPKPWKGEE